MIDTVHCAQCGRDVSRPSGPNPRCPACQWPLQAAPPPPVRSESSRAAARLASAPDFKSSRARGGFPIIPVAVGVVLILAITAFALLRGQPGGSAVVTPPSADLVVAKIGRPPEAPPPSVTEPDAVLPVVTIDLPDDEERMARARHRPASRPARVRPARPATPPVREAGRQEKPANRPAPVPAQKLEPEPEPVPLPPPPQIAAAPQAEAPSASAPLAIGSTVAPSAFQKPRTSTPGCVASSIRMPPDVADIGGTTATVKFSVDEAGKVSQFSYLSGPDDRAIGDAIWAAIRRCGWNPGANAQGLPTAQWVTMPIRFGK